MTTKAKELELLAAGRGCLGKAADDEPLFILRGQDRFAPALVRAWATLAREFGVDVVKTNEAFDCALAMEYWGKRKTPD